MFSTLFRLFRPKPRFDQGQLVVIENDFNQNRYLLVERRRWAVPAHEVKRQWVYDGPIFSEEDGKFSGIAYGYCFREEALAPILKYSGASARQFED